MAIFGFKKRKDEKLEQGAKSAKSTADKKSGAKGRQGGAKMTKAEKTDKVSKEKSVAVAVPVLHSGLESNAASVVIRPRVTEKSGILSQGGVYTFEVMKNANKHTISKAIQTLYKVTPVKIAVINTPMKNVFIKGRKGTVSGMRKAIITVKKGDKIDFV